MTPESNPNEPGKMKKIMSSRVDESIHARLPHEPNDVSAAEWESLPPEPVLTSPPPELQPRRWQFLPAFWTIASILSMVVNIVLIVLLLLAWQMFDRLRGLGAYGMGEASGVLGGLYENFVKMDRANITRDIDINETIPVQFTLDVSGPTTVRLTQPVTIRGATVSVRTGGLTITDANATIVLPVDQALPIRIESLSVPVDQRVPVKLKVPVKIPLRETDLHEPFVGLQEVVRPWYCLIQPNAVFDKSPVCVPSAAPATLDAAPLDPTLLDPSLRVPTPAETVLP
jgi:hypothetical protein